MSEYKEFNFKLEQPGMRDIFIALLSEAGFKGFVETPEGFLAYASENIRPDEILAGVLIPYKFSVREVKNENWNKSWEQHIKPLIIDEQIYIRTSFHPQKEYPYVVTIDPKMSFGTGHHETTYLMIKQMMSMDFKNRSVIDMGAGTGVLSILSEYFGATEIYAIDIDEWAYENMLENFEKNNTKNIQTFFGGAEILEDLPTVDIFLANINRNILLEDMKAYTLHIKQGGHLIISGFYEEDVPLLDDAAKQNGMMFVNKIVKNNWTSLKFVKL